MPFVVHCPTCSGPLRVSDDLAGRKVRCPSCSGVFDAPAADPQPSKPDGPVDTVPVEPWRMIDLSLDVPSSVPEAPLAHQPVGAVEIGQERQQPPPPPEELRHCPGCDRLLSAAAKRCPTCGESLATAPRDRRDEPRDIGPPVRRDAEPHRGSAILIMGVMSVAVMFFGCPLLVPWMVGIVLGILAWVMGSADLAKMRRGVMDSEGKSNTQAGWVCGIIGTFMNTVLLLTCGTVIGLAVWADTQQSQPKPKWGGPAPMKEKR